MLRVDCRRQQAVHTDGQCLLRPVSLLAAMLIMGGLGQQRRADEAAWHGRRRRAEAMIAMAVDDNGLGLISLVRWVAWIIRSRHLSVATTNAEGLGRNDGRMSFRK
ncbi:hypothetical protein ACLOJK_037253 [Asimina triloba]